MFDPTEGHRARGEVPARCRQHALTDDYYVPQLRRLLSGAPRERKVYEGFIDEVVATANPLDLFGSSQQRPGMYFIEALYRTQVEQAELAEWADPGDRVGRSYLAPLCYSRWVAWRRFGDAVRDRSVSFGGGVADYILRSRRDVISHVRSGWVPSVVAGDPELLELLDGR